MLVVVEVALRKEEQHKVVTVAAVMQVHLRDLVVEVITETTEVLTKVAAEVELVQVALPYQEGLADQEL
jgi:hypothetical protein